MHILIFILRPGASGQSKIKMGRLNLPKNTLAYTMLDMTISGHLQKAGLFCLLFLRINWKNDLVIILNIVRFGALPVAWMVAGMRLTHKFTIASKISPRLVWIPVLV